MGATNTSKTANLDHHVHAMVFPWFAFGHINPFLQLSNKLSVHGIQISFLSIPGNISRIKSSLEQSNLIQIIPLTIPEIEGLSPDFDSSSNLTHETGQLLTIALDKMQPQVKSLLTQLKPHIIIFDFAHYWVPSLAAELGIKAVNFSVFSAVANSYLTVPSRMSDPTNNPPTIEDLKKPPLGFPLTTVRSMQTFQARDFQYVFKSFNGGKPAFERVMGFIKTCDATIYKSCTEMEGPYINYLKTQLEIPLFLAGPIIPSPPFGPLEEKWATWLAKFPQSSVIFCNFGSETYLDNDLIKELSLGLELTNLPFILVLNFGTNDEGIAQAKLEEALPEGFTERVRGRGVVHTGWVQQQHILAHQNVGCYVNHSGFSSVVEGIVNGCQLVFVPQKGDQFLNSKLLSGDLRVGVEVCRRDEDGYFGKDDVLEAVKIVMEDVDNEPGNFIRDNLKKWKEFLLSQEVEDRYMVSLVKELQDLACNAGFDAMTAGAGLEASTG